MKDNSLAALFGDDADKIRETWDGTEAAGDFKPIPRGKYTCRLESGEHCESRRGTRGYKLTFRVLEGEHADRKLWYDVWLTPKAMPLTKRALAKIGFTNVAHLGQPIQRGYRCELTVVLKTGDDGIQRNEVKDFEVLGRDEPEVNPFAPKAKGVAA